MTKTLLTVASMVILLCACTAKEPDDIAKQYWRAMMTGDLEALEAVVTENSLAFIETVRTPEEGSEFSLGEIQRIDDGRIEIDTTVTMVQEGNRTVNHISTVLMKENNAWKVNLPQTRRGLYASLLDNAFSDMGSSLQDGAAALKELSAQFASEVNAEINDDLLDATKALKQQTQQANDTIQRALDDIQKELENK